MPADIPSLEKAPECRTFTGRVICADKQLAEVIPGEETDKTKALSELFAQAAKNPGSHLLLPGRRIDVSDTIDVPDNTFVDAAGLACVFMNTRCDDKPVFRLKDPTKVRFRNVILRGGKNALEITVPDEVLANSRKQRANTDSARLVYLTNCYFYDNASFSITALSGGQTNSHENDLIVYVDGGCAYTTKLYGGNASLAFFDSNWYSNTPDYGKEKVSKDFAAITNLGGKLVIKDMLGVPCVFCWTPMSQCNKPSAWDGGDYRWVDNHGDFHSFNFRFGGEWGGITPVYNYGKGRVRIEGGLVSFESRRIKQTPVFSDAPDPDVRIYNMITTHYREPVRLLYHNAEGDIKEVPHAKIYALFPFLRSGNKQPALQN